MERILVSHWRGEMREERRGKCGQNMRLLICRGQVLGFKWEKWQSINKVVSKKKRLKKKCHDASDRQTKRNREAKSFIQNLMLRLINVIRLFICV